jgi:hypothetical protein
MFILSRVAHDEPVHAPAFPDRSDEEAGAVAGKALASLREQGLVGGDPPRLSEQGSALYDRVVEARCDALRELVADWDPVRNPEIDPIVRRVADEVRV